MQYQDPRDPQRARPNLILGLMRQPSTAKQSPQENQFTESLAWLLDRSPGFARAFCRLFFIGDVDAEEALAQAAVIGARTQVSLPHQQTTLFPDLNVAGDVGTFDLLIEVKTGANPNEYEFGTETLLQPEMYIAAWRQAGGVQANLRRVGTLTPGYTFTAASTDELRAADVTFAEVYELLRELREKSQLEPEVELVAGDFAQALDQRVLHLQADLPAHAAALLQSAFGLVQSVSEAVASALGGAAPLTRINRDSHYVGAYVHATAPDGVKFSIWVFATPAGAPYNRYLSPDNLGIGIYFKQPGQPGQRLAAGGFTKHPDLAGYSEPRIYRALPNDDGLVTNADHLVADTVEAILTALAACDPPLRTKDPRVGVRRW
jgi:hypothetical protein